MPNVSRQGVQRDLLPLVEGTTVSTKHGMVKTDHILFIASGAFHLSKPSDLIPELQGRFPIRVELQSLSVADFEAILTQTHASLVQAIPGVAGDRGCDGRVHSLKASTRLAQLAFDVNERTENIGARRLSTVMERLLDDVSFDAVPAWLDKPLSVDAAYVNQRLGELAQRRRPVPLHPLTPCMGAQPGAPAVQPVALTPPAAGGRGLGQHQPACPAVCFEA